MVEEPNFFIRIRAVFVPFGLVIFLCIVLFSVILAVYSVMVGAYMLAKDLLGLSVVFLVISIVLSTIMLERELTR